MNATLGAVTVAPYSGAATLDAGMRAVECLNGKRAVILRNHGVVTVAPTLKDTLYAAVYLEDVCRAYCAASAIGKPRVLTPAQLEDAVEVYRHYGQGKR